MSWHWFHEHSCHLHFLCDPTALINSKDVDHRPRTAEWGLWMPAVDQLRNMGYVWLCGDSYGSTWYSSSMSKFIDSFFLVTRCYKYPFFDWLSIARILTSRCQNDLCISPGEELINLRQHLQFQLPHFSLVSWRKSLRQLTTNLLLHDDGWRRWFVSTRVFCLGETSLSRERT